MFCKHCNTVMRHVMSFYDGKAYEFDRCPNCWYESKKKPLKFSDKELNQKKTEFNTRTTSLNKSKKKRSVKKKC